MLQLKVPGVIQVGPESGTPSRQWLSPEAGSTTRLNRLLTGMLIMSCRLQQYQEGHAKLPEANPSIPLRAHAKLGSSHGYCQKRVCWPHAKLLDVGCLAGDHNAAHAGTAWWANAVEGV